MSAGTCVLARWSQEHMYLLSAGTCVLAGWASGGLLDSKRGLNGGD
jgi:hypothetical protein